MSRTIIVAGASGGLGSAIARRFAAEGERLVLNYCHSPKDAENLAQDLAAGPGEAMLYQADVKDFSQVKAMMEATVRKWGRVDVLVDAAGAIPQTFAGTPIAEMGEEEFSKYLDIDLKGAFHCIKSVAPQMIKQKDGHIIVLAGGSAFRAHLGWAGYAACKGGMISLCRTAAKELGAYNVKVNVVNPGPTIHPRLAYLFTPESMAQRSRRGLMHVLPNTQTPEELALLVVTLSKLKAVSGQVLFSDSRIVR